MLLAAQEKAVRNPNDLAAQAGFHNLLSKEFDRAPMLDHAKHYMVALLRQARPEQAYEVLRKCLAKDTAFRPMPESVLPLARFALLLKDYKTAMCVMNGFSKANPGHTDTPHVLFCSARALIEAGDRDTTQKFLEALIARYPQYTTVPEAKSLLQAPTGDPTTT